MNVKKVIREEQISLFIDNDKSTSLNNDELMLSTFEHTHEFDKLRVPPRGTYF